MRRSSVTLKIVVGFILAVALLLLIDVLALGNIRRLDRNSERVVHTLLVLDELDDVLLELKNAETGQRGYFLTGEETYLEPYHRAIQRVRDELDSVRALTRDNPEQQRLVRILDSLTAVKFAELGETIALFRKAGLDAAVTIVRTGRGKDVMDRIRAVADTMQGEERRLLEERNQASAKQTARTVAILAVGSAVGLVLMSAALLLILLDLRKRALAESALQQAHDELEARVQKRTEDLNRANEDLQEQIAQRELAGARLSDTLSKLAQSHADTRLVLDALNLGFVIVDRGGRIRFFSGVPQRVFGGDFATVEGRVWWEVLPLKPEDRRRLTDLCDADPADRERIAARIEAGENRSYWMEIDVQDDPANPQGRIFVLYDVSEIYDLRRLLRQDWAFDEIVGQSEPMRHVFQQIRALAPVDTTVLIDGDTGTGKELVAHAIHHASPRSGKPFIPVNAAGLTESILQSQLFGHRKGSFTGAVEDREGFFEAAHGGVLFLDEIGDVPPSVQTSLLRVLQEREVVRVGETRPRKVDVRVLAATQRDLAVEVEAGRFRADLLYRIRVGRISLPALRRRREDIPLLAQTFLSQLRGTGGKNVAVISLDAMALLLDYPWPGNVRELGSAIEYAVIRAAGSVIRPSDLPPEIRSFRDSAEQPALADGGADREEDRRITAALRAAGGNRTRAARILGVSRSTFYRRISDLGVPLPD